MDAFNWTTVTEPILVSTEENCSDEAFSLAVQLPASVLIVLLTACNIIGNTCTLLAFYKDPKLRTPHNCYIVNLAVTDLIVGFISVPFYAVYTIRAYYWQFGEVFCKVWSVLDFWVCAESALTIAMVSHDRFLLVKDGALYKQKHTRKDAVTKITISWILSFLLYGPAIIFFDFWRGYSTVEDGDCDVEFATDFWYVLVTAIIEFVAPAVLLIVFNAYIFWKIRVRTFRGKNKSAAKHSAAENGHSNLAFPVGVSKGSSASFENITTRQNVQENGLSSDFKPKGKEQSSEIILTIHKELLLEKASPSQRGNTPKFTDAKLAGCENPNLHITKCDLSITKHEKHTLEMHGFNVTSKENQSNGLKAEQSGFPPGTTTSHQAGDRSFVASTSTLKSSTAERNMRRYQKAARSLIILVLVFSICWLPYTVSSITSSVCDVCVDDDLIEGFSWLLWLNSSLNPFLYAAMNPLFRRHYKKLLCPKCVAQKRTEKTQRDEQTGRGSMIEKTSNIL